jgi:hypothetical protein
MMLFPGAHELSAAEFASLLLIAPGFISSHVIPKAHQVRLIELGLIRKGMGGLLATPAGHMAARMQVGR